MCVVTSANAFGDSPALIVPGAQCCTVRQLMQHWRAFVSLKFVGRQKLMAGRENVLSLAAACKKVNVPGGIASNTARVEANQARSAYQTEIHT